MYFFLTFISSYLGLVQQEGFENLEAIRSAGVKVILLAKSHFFFCCFNDEDQLFCFLNDSVDILQIWT